MDFPEWTPHCVSSAYLDLVKGEQDFSAQFYTSAELTIHANKKGYPNWQALQSYLVALRECFYRLSYDAGAKKSYEWLGSDKAISRMLCQVRECFDHWYRVPQLTKNEYLTSYSEIADLAISLAGKLSLHFGASDFPQSFPALVPDSYKESAAIALHPELADRAKQKGISPNIYIGAGLPPLHVILYQLAEKARKAVPSENIPRKAHSASALRQSMVRGICFVGYSFGCVRSSLSIADLVGVVLGDDSISDATIRADMSGKDWWPD